MSNRRKIFLGVAGFYVLALILLAAFVGSAGKNDEFKPQNEFKLVDWINLPGPFDINKAVLYVVIAALLTVGTMFYVARRMQQRPNRIQTAIETLYVTMRDNITRGNMDDRMAAKWFPFIGTIFLFIWFSNIIGYLPLPTNTEHTVNIFGVHVPSLALFAATANLSVPLVLTLVATRWTEKSLRPGMSALAVGVLLALLTAITVVAPKFRIPRKGEERHAFEAHENPLFFGHFASMPRDRFVEIVCR